MTDQQDENKLIAERRAKLDVLRTQDGATFPNQFQPASYNLSLAISLKSN
jgi:hypothetical protein